MSGRVKGPDDVVREALSGLHSRGRPLVGRLDEALGVVLHRQE